MCYAPVNYDDHFRGPMTIRNALAQSINIPAVQGIYLAGVSDSIITAKSMGISSLNDHGRYGLSLVLGGGEVSLLDITSAYSVFANNGVRNAYNPILLVEDAEGKVVDKRSPSPNRVLSEQVSRLINDILSDNIARTPGFGVNSALYIPSRPVAVKTGTSNDYRDAWIIGYTPNLTVGAWVGNNDSRPMERKVSGLVVAPLWHEYMESILSKFPIETFNPPEPEDLSNLKPILRGDWSTGGTHSILYWIDKDNPRGPTPINPSNDPQFLNWEYGIQLWSILNNLSTTTQATTTPN
jgi:membrane peptidoglycan carboxypeptidase